MWPLRHPHHQSQPYPAWLESSSQDQTFPGGGHSSPSDAALLACFFTQNRSRFLWGNPPLDLRCQPPPMEDIPGGSEGKASAYNVGDLGLILESGSFPGEGNGNLLQYSCLENSMDVGSWWAIPHGVPKSWT